LVINQSRQTGAVPGIARHRFFAPGIFKKQHVDYLATMILGMTKRIG
jgi:hypothetical protein